MDSDVELLKALKQGEEVVWETAFRKLYPCAFAAAQHPSAALTPSEAEDVAIETLTQLVGKISTVKKFDELKALAVTMATRRAISSRRKKHAEKRGGNQTASLDQMKEESEGQFEPTGAHTDTLTATDLLELSRLLQEALGCLDSMTCKLMCDCMLHGKTYREVADQYQIPIGTVGILLYRGLEKVRSRLNQTPRLLKELRLFLR